MSLIGISFARKTVFIKLCKSVNEGLSTQVAPQAIFQAAFSEIARRSFERKQNANFTRNKWVSESFESEHFHEHGQGCHKKWRVL